MPAHNVLETLTLVLATGLASQLIADLLRLPRMVLLLAAGMSLGPHALDAVELRSWF
jgi:NhaP-type Na+/H+ or K+/H+ antiporter